MSLTPMLDRHTRYKTITITHCVWKTNVVILKLCSYNLDDIRRKNVKCIIYCVKEVHCVLLLLYCVKSVSSSTVILTDLVPDSCL